MGGDQYSYILYWVLPVVIILPIGIWYTTRGAVSRIRLQGRLQRVIDNGHAVLWVPPNETHELVEGDNKKNSQPLIRELNLSQCNRLYELDSTDVKSKISDLTLGTPYLLALLVSTFWMLSALGETVLTNIQGVLSILWFSFKRQKRE
ncbi:hypothetical protein FRC17_003309 [Serendipita sp. 399]|nr:hypothetical protein FRC17_003309 [Serendipita sp. 399]